MKVGVEDCGHFDFLFYDGDPRIISEVNQYDLSPMLLRKIDSMSISIYHSTLMKKADTVIINPNMEHLLHRRKYERDLGEFDGMKLEMDQDLHHSHILVINRQLGDEIRLRAFRLPHEEASIQIIDARDMDHEQKKEYQKKFRGCITIKTQE